MKEYKLIRYYSIKEGIINLIKGLIIESTIVLLIAFGILIVILKI